MLVFVLLFVVYLILLYFLQDYIIYAGINRYCISLKDKYESIGPGCYYKKGTTGTLWIVLGGNESLPEQYTDIIDEYDHSFVTVSYPGYGENRTKYGHCPRSDTVVSLLDTILKEVVDDYKDIRFICHSMGCGIGLYYLSHKKLHFDVNKVILLAPFWSLIAVISESYYSAFISDFLVKYIVRSEWNNYENIQLVDPKTEIHIYHGRYDSLISWEQSYRLKCLRNISQKKYNGPKTVYTLTKHTHHFDIPFVKKILDD